ncbi:SRPBCC family protein [Leptospira wolffii]|uniref:SRPBCC family protein n=1 Tax=Leptospira wolffii TaxID=409998 RepID=A0ABV5BTP3_9LEPT|nr:SRPBCC family protein [Leptospira wolffii]TGL55365.1 hypothetical protein EHQ61_00465 [Leptospira wolffii]
MSGTSEVKFVYSTYIAAEPEKIWEALTNGEFTKVYWFGRGIEGDWRVGGKFRFLDPEGRPEVEGEILKCEKPRLLSYTWAVPADHPMMEAFKERMEKSSAPTKVTFLLKKMKDLTKLTLIHEDLLPEDIIDNPDTFMGLNNGWPAILSSLKSLLETGKALVYEF